MCVHLKKKMVCGGRRAAWSGQGLGKMSDIKQDQAGERSKERQRGSGKKEI